MSLLSILESEMENPTPGLGWLGEDGKQVTAEEYRRQYLIRLAEQWTAEEVEPPRRWWQRLFT